jgi:hypothetical protein
MRKLNALALLIFLGLADATAVARTLSVGPGGQYSKPSAAIAAAAEGDTIQIDAAGNYDNDVALIGRSNLTIEGVDRSGGRAKAKIRTDGRVYGRKGIWVFAEGASNLRVRNIDFEGARVSEGDGANGAGIRALGRNLTLDNCRFYNNQDGILGGFGTTTITGCEFDHNGLTGLTHNLYIADQAGTLIFRCNYSHDTAVGHLLKSRAAINVIQYNRLTDNTGTGSYELDLPNGGFANVVGNIIQQSKDSQNSVIFAYGEEGVINPKSELNVINNTFVNDRATGTFISAQKLPSGFKLTMKNNIFAGPGTTISMNLGEPFTGGNMIEPVVEKAGFVDEANYNYALTKDSSAIGVGVDAGKDGRGETLAAIEEYVEPMSLKHRKRRGHDDAGANAFFPNR